MSMLTRAIRPLVVKCFVADGPTRIRRGHLRGRLLPADVAAKNLSMVFGTYERAIQNVLMEQARGCGVAYDIGAHVGFMTLLLAEVVSPAGKVISFEPSPREAAAVESLIRCNGLDGKVIFKPWAVSDRDGEATFRVSDKSFTGILEDAPESRRDGATSTVPTVSLDTFVYEQGNPAPDFIKLDVESAEAMVIAGARTLLRQKRPRMVVEVHGPDATRETIASLLSHDYRIAWLERGATTTVTSPDQLLPIFTKNRWTAHVLALPS